MTFNFQKANSILQMAILSLPNTSYDKRLTYFATACKAQSSTSGARKRQAVV